METDKKEKSLESGIIKHFTKVLLPGDAITLKFKCPKFAYLEVVVREIPEVLDPSLSVSHE